MPTNTPNAIMPDDHQERVAKFMGHAKQKTPRTPCIPDEETRLLRARLILEEALETVNALGVSVYDHIGTLITEEDLDLRADCQPNLVEIADGCADVAVVTTGTALACGIDMRPIQKLVDENNLAKFGPGHSFREDGKLQKPPGHKPPNIQSEIWRQQGLCWQCGHPHFSKETMFGMKTGDRICDHCGAIQ